MNFNRKSTNCVNLKRMLDQWQCGSSKLSNESLLYKEANIQVDTTWLSTITDILMKTGSLCMEGQMHQMNILTG